MQAISFDLWRVRSGAIDGAGRLLLEVLESRRSERRAGAGFEAGPDVRAIPLIISNEAEPGANVCCLAAGPASMTHSPYTFEIVSDACSGGLKDDWDSLYDRQCWPHLSDSFDWALLSWNTVTSDRRRRPYCIVMRRDKRTVAIWPLVITPGALVNVASPMNSESSEYCPCLLDPEEPPTALWARLHEELRSRKDVDALRLPHVRRGTPIGKLMCDLPESRATLVQPAPMVRASDFPTPDHYTAWLPASTRATLRRGRRNLDQMGRVEIGEIASAQERIEVVQWVLARKCEWLQRRDLVNERFLSKSNAEFLAATLGHPWTVGSRRVFSVKLDGALVAAEVVNVDSRRVEAFTSSFDPAFEKCSPGHLLTSEVIRWALDRGLDYDFRLGSEPYKLKWSNHVVPVTSYLLPLTFRGKHFVRYRLARRWVSQRTPRPLRRLIPGLRPRLGSSR